MEQDELRKLEIEMEKELDEREDALRKEAEFLWYLQILELEGSEDEEE